MATKIPRAAYAFLNGSATWACRFPEDCGAEGVEVLAEGAAFDTPYGKTVPLKLVRLGGEKPKDALVIPMHGWHLNAPHISHQQSSDQVFWLMREAGVKKILSDAGVGGLNPLLEIGDVILPDDFIEARTRRAETFGGQDMRMGAPFCGGLRELLLEEARKVFPRVMRRGTTVVTEGPRFATRAEVHMLRAWGGDIVGQSITPDVTYARAIGACIAVLNLVAYLAEDSGSDWPEAQLREFYNHNAPRVGRVLIEAMRRADSAETCPSCGWQSGGPARWMDNR